MSAHVTCILVVAFLHLFPPGGPARLSTFTTHKAPQTSTAWTAGWSSDDRFVAIGNDKGELSIYETESWKKLKSWRFPITTITRIEWNPKHPILAVASFSHAANPATVQLYDMANDRVIKTLADTLMGRALSWRPDGEEVAFAGARGAMAFFGKDGSHRRTLSFRHPRTIMDIDWHPTKNLLLVVEEDMMVLDIDNDRLLATYDDGSTGKGILCCQWHPSGAFFVTGDYGHEAEGAEPSYLKYWTAAGVLKKRLKESRFEYRNLRWSGDGKYLAAATDVLLVCNKNGDVVSKTRLGSENLWGIGWNSKGDKLITSDQAGTVRVTDRAGNVIKTFVQ